MKYFTVHHLCDIEVHVHICRHWQSWLWVSLQLTGGKKKEESVWLFYWWTQRSLNLLQSRFLKSSLLFFETFILSRTVLRSHHSLSKEPCKVLVPKHDANTSTLSFNYCCLSASHPWHTTLPKTHSSTTQPVALKK